MTETMKEFFKVELAKQFLKKDLLQQKITRYQVRITEKYSEMEKIDAQIINLMKILKSYES